MIYVCLWDDLVTLVIDAPDVDAAAAAATEHAKVTPKRIVMLPPGVFAAELSIADVDESDGDDSPGFVALDLLEHVADVLRAIEEADEPPAPAPVCGSEAMSEDGARVLACEAVGPHARHTAMDEGRRVYWEVSP